MNNITIRFYGKLNDFLPQERRQISFQHYFWGQAQAKDLIESLGVPHTEVDLLLVDDESAPFTRLLFGTERIAVYPPFKRLDIARETRVIRMPISGNRFLLDSHLGKLAKYLRMVGFDTFYQKILTSEQLAELSSDQNRILLTRDRNLLKRSQVIHGYYIRAQEPTKQLTEVLDHFDLLDQIQPFQRCMHCNEPLLSVSKKEILDEIPDQVRQYCEEFTRCTGCARIYWKGTHFAHMNQLIDQLRNRCD